ncbi:MAG: hypothetical protein J2P17_18555 [Mycobacterium sp.]|nr:hypothetical protein [Mycobacterium sp.]
MGEVEPGEGDGAGADPQVTVELLADLQAGLLDNDAAARLRNRVRTDPKAQQVVHALNRVRQEVGAVGTDLSTAPAVAPAAIDRIVAALRAAPRAAHGSRSRLRAQHAGRPADLPRLARVLAAIAGLAAATVAVGLGTSALIAAPAPTSSGPTTAHQITVSRSPMQIPLSDPQILALLDRKPNYGALADPQRRASCLGGLGYPAGAEVLGAQPMEIAGRAAVLLVLSAGTSGSVTALAVAPTCSSVNTGLLADRAVDRP